MMKLLKGLRKIEGSDKGFTLIELLVVIAIIGVLSSIVLASLNTARNKGANAAVKGNLANVRAQAELYYDTNGNYGGATSAPAACPNGTGSMFGADTVISNMITAAATAGGGLSNTRCYSSGTAWLVSAPLKTIEGTFNYWCVDSIGNSVGKANQMTNSATSCNSYN